MDVNLLKEESGQVVYLYANNKWNKCVFMWFYKNNIEVFINGILLAIKKSDIDLLELRD